MFSKPLISTFTPASLSSRRAQLRTALRILASLSATRPWAVSFLHWCIKGSTATK